MGNLLLMAFVVLPIAWQQGIYLLRDMPGMLNKISDFAATLQRRYPALMDAGIIDAMAENMSSRMLTMGDSVVKISLASLVGFLTIATDGVRGSAYCLAAGHLLKPRYAGDAQ